MSTRINGLLASFVGATLAASTLAHPGCDPAVGAEATDVVATTNGAALPEPITKRELIEQIRRAERVVFPLVAACYDINNPPRDEIIAHIEQTIYGLGQRYNLGGRWSGGQGNPITLTWSLVPDGLSIPSGVGEGTGNSELFSHMDSLFATHGGRAVWIAKMQECYDRWQALSGITFERVTFGGNDWDDGASWNASGADGLRGEMRVAMKTIDLGGGVLAYNFFPGSGNGGNMVMDRNEGWDGSANNYRFMRNIVTHELGHGIGIQHVCPANATKLMEPFVSTAYDGPRHDDVRAVQRHYGDIYEINDTLLAASDLGTISDGQVVTPCAVPGIAIPFGSTCGVDASNDDDYFRFTVSDASDITIVVAPVGTTYDSSTQAGGGGCNSGNDINSLALVNIAIELLDQDGVVIGFANNSPPGGAEGIEQEIGVGTYTLRVYNIAGATSQTQLYTVSVGVETVIPRCLGDTNGDGVVDFTDFSRVSSQYGQVGAGWSGDLNGDGAVDFADFSEVLANYGSNCN